MTTTRSNKGGIPTSGTSKQSSRKRIKLESSKKSVSDNVEPAIDLTAPKSTVVITEVNDDDEDFIEADQSLKKSEAPFHVVDTMHVTRYFKNNLGARFMTPGKVLSGSVYKDCSLVGLFESVGLGIFVFPATTYYPNLVRQFYANVDFGSASITSHVKGKSFEVNDLMFAGMFNFGLPGGILPSTLRGTFEIEGLSELEQLKVVTGDDTLTDFKLPVVSDLSPLALLVFKVIINTVAPRQGGTSKLTGQDLILTALVLTGRKFDITRFVWKYMESAITNKQRGLPYGLLLTKLFDWFGIPLGKEDHVAADVMDEGFLKSVSLQLNEVGELVRLPKEPTSFPSILDQPGGSGVASGYISKAPSGGYEDFNARLKTLEDVVLDIKSKVYEHSGYMETTMNGVRELLKVCEKYMPGVQFSTDHIIPGPTGKMKFSAVSHKKCEDSDETEETSGDDSEKTADDAIKDADQ